MSLAAIILAAGKGTRMRSKRAKVLHELGGERADRACDPRRRRAKARANRDRRGPSGWRSRGRSQLLRSAIRAPGAPARNRRRRSMRPRPDRRGLRRRRADRLRRHAAIAPATLRAFLDAHRKRGAKLSFISIMLDDPGAYGRVIRDGGGRVEKIVEFRDASPAERAIQGNQHRLLPGRCGDPSVGAGGTEAGQRAG